MDAEIEHNIIEEVLLSENELEESDDEEAIYPFQDSEDEIDDDSADFLGFFSGRDIQNEIDGYSYQGSESKDNIIMEPNYFNDQTDENYYPVEKKTVKKSQKSSKDIVQFFCDFCNFSAKTRFALKKHLSKHTIVHSPSYSDSSDSGSTYEQEVVYQCPFCKYSTNVETLFENHGKAHLETQIAATRLLSNDEIETKPKYKKVTLKKSYKKVKKKSLSPKKKIGRKHIKSIKNSAKMKSESVRKIYTKSSSRTYKCYICNFTCGNYTVQKNHLATHKGQFFKCSMCSFTSDKNNDFIRHSITHSEERKFRCTVCSKAFKTNADLKCHIPIHSSIKEFQCPDCVYQTSRSYSLKRHYIVAHTDSPENFNKQVRKRKTWFQKNMEVKKEETASTNMYNCPDCHFTTLVKSVFIIHQAMHVNNSYKCLKCEFATSLPSVLRRHEETHLDIKKYSCDRCEYMTNHKTGFRNHMKTHTGEKQYKCPHCPYETIYKACLQRHQVVHEIKKEKYFQCELCDYQTQFKNDLQLHLLDHR